MSADLRYQKTNLWQRTLAPQDNDADAESRSRLRQAFLLMRERVEPLAAQVHQDCAGLTVHDVTHLDALWETADKIIGDDYPVTPVEAFVFGAAVLIHDSAMAIAAYSEGLKSLRETREWRDAIVSSLRKQGIDINENEIVNPPDHILKIAIFSVLRALHASQAEKLMTMTWSPGGKQEVRLLEDSDLREYYGFRIGRIAHSHHWDAARLTKVLHAAVTPMVGLPSEWMLDEVKVACMLRCADAAHIDARRAPRMLYAIKSPQGTSDEHWRFQNKIGQIATVNRHIFYSSSPFDQSEASSWWLAFDIANMIDREIQSAQAVLEEIGDPLFLVQGVEGVKSPRQFSKRLPVEGWEPVDAEVRVTDPIHLALTLGGKNLYGRGFMAPVRELLQNSVDAIRGRRGDRPPEDFSGLIRVHIQKGTSASGSDEIWFHIDDNGMGMTQRVMTGPLIDFGKSIWSSSLLAEEYPGLSASLSKPIGKFGIGFFSAFLLGDNVKVISKKYDSAASDALVLEFSALNMRPILRKADVGELPEDISTRVSIRVNSVSSGGDVSFTENPSNIFEYVVHLSAALDVNVKIIDDISNRKRNHNFDWMNVAPETFLDEMLALLPAEQRNPVKRTYSHLLRPIKKGDQTYGRAALSLNSRSARDGLGFASVGGVLYPAGNRYNIHEEYSHGMSSVHPIMTNYVGVIEGATDNAARESAMLHIPREAFVAWLGEQAGLIDPNNHETLSLIPISHFIISSGGIPANIPAFFCGGRFVSYETARSYISQSENIHLLLKKNYKDGLALLQMDSLPVTLFANEIKNNVFCATSRDTDIFEEDEGRRMFKAAPVVLDSSVINRMKLDFGAKVLIDMAKDVWGANLIYSVHHIDVMSQALLIPAPARLVLTVSRKASA